MRVKLPDNALPLEPATPPAPNQSATLPLSRRAPTPAERIINALTQWRSAAPVLGLCAALLTWSLVIRQPEGARLLKVSARAKALAADPVATNVAALTAEQVATLRQEIKSLSAVLVNHRKEIPPLLAQLETRARELGWRSERSMKAAQPSPSGQTNLTLHPVVLRLSPAAGQAGASYLRLLEWLNSVTALEKRAEVVSVHVQADGAGISSAEIKLHFFSTPAHEEIAAK